MVIEVILLDEGDVSPTFVRLKDFLHDTFPKACDCGPAMFGADNERQFFSRLIEQKKTDVSIFFDFHPPFQSLNQKLNAYRRHEKKDVKGRELAQPLAPPRGQESRNLAFAFYLMSVSLH